MENRKKHKRNWFDVEHPCGLSLKTRKKEIEKIKKYLQEKSDTTFYSDTPFYIDKNDKKNI